MGRPFPYAKEPPAGQQPQSEAGAAQQPAQPPQESRPTPEQDAEKEAKGDGFQVKDKRFWQQSGQGEAAAGEAQASPKKPSYVAELEQKLEASQTRLTETLTQYKEALADFEQAKARLRRDIHKEIDQGKRALLVDLLDVIDNLDRALEATAASKAPASGSDAYHALLSGVTMVRDQFAAKLSSLGVTKVELLGRPFDPSCSEAISTVPCSDPAQDGLVVGVITPCYRLGEDVLRHGVVAVARCSDAQA